MTKKFYKRNLSETKSESFDCVDRVKTSDVCNDLNVMVQPVMLTAVIV